MATIVQVWWRSWDKQIKIIFAEAMHNFIRCFTLQTLYKQFACKQRICLNTIRYHCIIKKEHDICETIHSMTITLRV